MKLKLKARVSRSDARTIRHAFEQLSAKGSVRKAGDEFVVEAEMEGVGTSHSQTRQRSRPAVPDDAAVAENLLKLDDGSTALSGRQEATVDHP
jgi:hypothetical protein